MQAVVEPELDKRLVHVADGDVYADRGEWITCENGHRIARFVKSVKSGQLFDLYAISEWQQHEPAIGEFPIPRCEKCGAEWCAGSQYHFLNGWRVK
jgi:hypothetical protein